MQNMSRIKVRKKSKWHLFPDPMHTQYVAWCGSQLGFEEESWECMKLLRMHKTLGWGAMIFLQKGEADHMCELELFSSLNDDSQSMYSVWAES